MKATGIVRRIDDLGRVVIPKEIRRTLRIRDGDPLEIYTSREGEVVFRKYSPLAGLEGVASQVCQAIAKSTNAIAAIADRDTVLASAGGGRRELLGRRLSPELEEVLEGRSLYAFPGGDSRRIYLTDGGDQFSAAVAAPILSEGDAMGLVLLVQGRDDDAPTETQCSLVAAMASFLGKYLEP